jgi:regulatory protein
VVITKIIRHKKHRNRYAVYVDGALAFDVSDDVILRFGLRSGDGLDEKKVEQILTAEAQYRAQTIAVNYISYRPRSSKEVADHLTKKGFSRELAKKTVQHLQKKNLINDDEFAQTFVRDRLKRKPTGAAMLRQQLLLKGIAPNLIERALKNSITDEDQQHAAEELAAKRLRLAHSSLEKLNPMKRKRRIFEYLLRHGFSSDVATRTVRVVFSRQAESNPSGVAA